MNRPLDALRGFLIPVVGVGVGSALWTCGPDATLVPAPPPAPKEVCNFRDDNGDGQVDEGFDWSVGPWTTVVTPATRGQTLKAVRLSDGSVAVAGGDGAGYCNVALHVGADRGFVVVLSETGTLLRGPTFTSIKQHGFVLPAIAAGAGGEIGALFSSTDYSTQNSVSCDGTPACTSCPVYFGRFDGVTLSDKGSHILPSGGAGAPLDLGWTAAGYVALTDESASIARITWRGSDGTATTPSFALNRVTAGNLTVGPDGVAWVGYTRMPDAIQLGLLSLDGKTELLPATPLSTADGLGLTGRSATWLGHDLAVTWTEKGSGSENQARVARWSTTGEIVAGPLDAGGADEKGYVPFDIVAIDNNVAIALNSHGKGDWKLLRLRGDLTPVATPRGALSLGKRPDGDSIAVVAAGAGLLVVRSNYGSSDGKGSVEVARVTCLPWSKSAQSGSAYDATHQIATDGAGNVILAGGFQGTLDLGAGQLTSATKNDVYLGKLDPYGNTIWSKRFGDTRERIAGGVAANNAGNIAIAGSYSGAVSNGFAARLDGDGNPLWSQELPGEGANAVAITGMGGVLAAGGLNTGATDHGAFVSKFAANGTSALWSKQFSNGARNAAFGVAADRVENVLVTGSFQNTVDFGCGNRTSPGTNADDVFVVELGDDGKCIWSNRYGDDANQKGTAVAVMSTGSVVAGEFYGSIDFGDGLGPHTSAGALSDVFVVALDTGGKAVWSRQFAGKDEKHAGGIAVDAAGNVLVAMTFGGTVDLGGSTLTSAGKTDVGVVKLDPKGKLLWGQRFGDSERQQVSGVAVDGAGGVLLTGSFAGSIDFGNGPLTSPNGAAIFIAKLAP